MAQSLKVALLRTTDCSDTSVKPALNEIEGIRVMAELSLADDLVASLNQTRSDVLIVMLGESSAHLLLGQIGDLIKDNKDLSVILAGPKRDPDLLLTAMRSGVREFTELPVDPEHLLELLQKILEVKPTRQMGKCVVLHGSGGGCGTSTLACNLGVEIARSGRGKVVLVDLDMHMGQLGAMLDVPQNYSLLDLCTIVDDDVEPARLNDVLLKHSSGLRLVARPREMTGADIPLLSRTVNILHHLMDMYDYILVDLDLKQDVTDGKIVTLADEFFLILQPVINSVRNASQLLRTLSSDDFQQDRLRLVLNRIPRKLGLLRKENIEKNLNNSIYWEIPEDYEAVSGSINMGLPLCEHATSSRACRSIRDLALAITTPGSDPNQAQVSREGFLKRLFQGNLATSK